MTPGLHREAGTLFDRLRALPQAEQATELDLACAGKPELREHVQRLLDADREAARESFLGGRAVDDASWLLEAHTTTLPAAGSVIGNYRLESRIGSGGMGVVYRGHDLRLERAVAVKILPLPATQPDSESVKRFAREARAASRLNHPNIVSIYDADFDHGFYYIATEFIEGQTLRQMLAAQPTGLDVKTVLDIVAQTASALSSAHGAGIVHRDIKPENIMLRPDGFVKVLDFGLAKPYESAIARSKSSELTTGAGLIAGTTPYLSPEQVLGQPADPRSDLFSLGVVAYELATGVRPFGGPTIGAAFNAIVNHIPPAPSKLRPALGSEVDRLILRLLEKQPERRIQTAVEVQSSGRLAATLVPRPRNRHRLAAIVVTALTALAAGVFWLARPLPPPRVTQIVEITNDPLPKRYLVTDGTRLFYAAGNNDSEINMFQMSASGGDPAPLPQLQGMFPLDISPDHSRLLLGRSMTGSLRGPFSLWSADTLGNSLRRLGDLSTAEARWSPTGDQIVYAASADLRLAPADGSVVRTVVTMPGIVHLPAWSPDRRTIRFTLLANNTSAIWEVRPDGTGLHAVFPGAHHPQSAGVWTSDGKHFVYAEERDGNASDLWAVRCPRLLELRPPEPQRITAGPMMANHPEVSPDGQHIFFLADFDRGELIRYNQQTHGWEPYLGGISANQLDFSRDGKWVVWVSCPDGVLWRSAADGSQRLQLSVPPLRAVNPRWSPDGSRIAFYGAAPGQPSRLYLVPFAGGTVRQITHGEAGPGGDADGTWSPDGESLAFAANSEDQIRERLPLRIMNLHARRISELPESLGLWSPDGRYLAALRAPGHGLWLYDLKTHARKALTPSGAGFPSWSPDSHSIYYEDTSMGGWHRVWIEDGRIELLVSLKDLKMPRFSLGWVGLAPDGSAVATRGAGGTQIYRLDWDAQ